MKFTNGPATSGAYQPICPIAGRPGYYEAFKIPTEAEARQALINAWSTPEQQYYNLTTDQCPDCRGRGYAVYRSRGQLVREAVGCQSCFGLGKISRY